MIFANKVTMYRGVKEKHFVQIPYRYWIFESALMLTHTYIGMTKVWFTDPKKVIDGFGSYLLACLLVAIITVLFPLAPLVQRAIVKDENEKNGIFFMHSSYVNKRLPTFAVIVGADVRSFDISNEADAEELKTIMWMAQFDDY